MTLKRDLDLESAWVLHMVSLRGTFEMGLMKIVQRVQEIWSGHKSVTEGQWRTDRQRPFLNPP